MCKLCIRTQEQHCILKISNILLEQFVSKYMVELVADKKYFYILVKDVVLKGPPPF